MPPYRQAVNDTIHWYQQPQRKPLVIRGARQVGKTTAVRLATAALGIPVVEIDLECHPELKPVQALCRLKHLFRVTTASDTPNPTPRARGAPHVVQTWSADVLRGAGHTVV